MCFYDQQRLTSCLQLSLHDLGWGMWGDWGRLMGCLSMTWVPGVDWGGECLCLVGVWAWPGVGCWPRGGGNTLWLLTGALIATPPYRSHHQHTERIKWKENTWHWNNSIVQLSKKAKRWWQHSISLLYCVASPHETSSRWREIGDRCMASQSSWWKWWLR